MKIVCHRMDKILVKCEFDSSTEGSKLEFVISYMINVDPRKNIKYQSITCLKGVLDKN